MSYFPIWCIHGNLLCSPHPIIIDVLLNIKVMQVLGILFDNEIAPLCDMYCLGRLYHSSQLPICHIASFPRCIQNISSPNKLGTTFV
jgi:hypothetical protein